MEEEGRRLWILTRYIGVGRAEVSEGAPRGVLGSGDRVVVG
jgi:hypothetical protein